MREFTLQQLPTSTVNPERKLRIALAIVIAICTLLWSCSTAPKPAAEGLAPAPATPTEKPAEPATLAAAESHEVQDAVKRVFKESVVIDTSRQRAFVTGDFNGDLSQDLAVVLKPTPAKLPDLNEEYPAWILRDLSGSTKSKSPRLAIAADEELLAVIHGFGAKGWRDQQATQTFLLKNAAGSKLEAQPAKSVLAANRGRKAPSLGGDVVAEVLDGRPGYIYYRNASYVWYDPRTFAGEAGPRRVHGDGAQKMK